MPEGPDPAGTHAGDARAVPADARAAAADARDRAADDRDTVADHRDVLADRREQQLDQWQALLQKWELQLGLTGGEGDGEAARQRLAHSSGTVLAAAFARIAEGLHASECADELLTRIAEAALAMITGATGAAVTVHDPGSSRSGSADGNGDGTALSFPLGTGSLEVFAADPAALDPVARELGFILAAHASLAARSMGERDRLEAVGRQLQGALLSRDVIGQAKGILMERLRLTPEEAFAVLQQSSQRLNVKLREVARSLAETGRLPPADGAAALPPASGGGPRADRATDDRLA